ARAEVQGGGRTLAAGTKTVFVVEQNTKLQDKFRERLKELGYRVLISMHPSQAVTRFQSSPFHALLMDCRTAEREGLEAYQRVMRDAELKRLDCAGILILSAEQDHWVDTVDYLQKSAVLVGRVTMRQIIEKLDEFAPVERPAVEGG